MHRIWESPVNLLFGRCEGMVAVIEGLGVDQQCICSTLVCCTSSATSHFLDGIVCQGEGPKVITTGQHRMPLQPMPLHCTEQSHRSSKKAHQFTFSHIPPLLSWARSLCWHEAVAPSAQARSLCRREAVVRSFIPEVRSLLVLSGGLLNPDQAPLLAPSSCSFGPGQVPLLARSGRSFFQSRPGRLLCH